MRGPTVTVAPAPDVLAAEDASLRALDAVPTATPIGIVLLEPLAGPAGLLLHSACYLRAVRALCDRHKALLVFDEETLSAPPFFRRALTLLRQQPILASVLCT